MPGFKIIAIGSSAGGLIPLKEIIALLPYPLPAAVVLVPHLLKDRESNLASILQKDTSIPIVKVFETTKVESGFIYTLGEGKIMTMQNGSLILRDRGATENINRSIDLFFTSLAEDAGANGVGVILSGGGYDGLLGAKAIEDKNGLVIVQEPYTAQFPLMPESLIANDHPDYILPPPEIAEKLKQHIAAA